MNIPISERLLACANFVARGDRVADIGCDHGYLGIYLLKNGIAKNVIASDIRPQPLQSAVRNGAKYGVSDKMSFHLSDGARGIPRDFDVLVCAGMGADTMVSILEAAPWLQSKQYRLILQCQSKTPLLRSYLSEHGWRIAEEAVLRDGRFLYTVMEVWYQPDYPHLTEAECYFPPALLENPSKEVPAYYQWIVGGVALSAAHQPEKQPLLDALNALAQTEELAWLKEEAT